MAASSLSEALADQTLVRKRFAFRLADDDDVFQKRRAVPDLFDLGQSRFVHDNRPRPAVVDQILIIFGEHPRIGRHRDRADLDGAEKAIGELRRVRQDDQHAVFDLYAEIFECVAGAVNFFEDFLVGDVLILVVNGDFAAATLRDIFIDEGRGGVVDIRKVEFHRIADRSRIENQKIENGDPRSFIFGYSPPTISE